MSFYLCISAYSGNSFLYIDPNLSDCTTFILNELICSLLVGFSRYRQDQLRSVEKLNFDKLEVVPNYNLNEIDLNLELNNNELNDFLIENTDVNIMRE